MSLNVAYSYCTNLTKEQKLEIDKKVRKNRFELKYAVFFPFLLISILPVEGFNPQQIIRNARDRAQSAAEEKLRPLAESVDDCTEAYNEYKDAKKTIESAEELAKAWEKLNAKVLEIVKLM